MAYIEVSNEEVLKELGWSKDVFINYFDSNMNIFVSDYYYETRETLYPPKEILN